MVVVNPVGQLCNRLVAIASGFTFALITGRALLVDDNGFYCSLNDLFETPGWSWLDLARASNDARAHVLQNPESGVWSETEPLLCADYQEHYAQSPAAHFMMNQYTVPYMTTNPHYRRQLLRLFGDPRRDGIVASRRPQGASPTSNGTRGGDDDSMAFPDQLFYSVSRFLFRPLPKLRAWRDQYIQTHFHYTDSTGAPRRYVVVGLQVRSGGDFTEHFMSSADWQLYAACGRAAVGSVASDPTMGAAHGVKFFVATDTEKGRKAAIAALGADTVMFGPGEFLNSDHPEGVQKALLDLLILATCDDLVTTSWSSYGYFAAGTSGRPANIVVDEVPPSQWRSPVMGSAELSRDLPSVRAAGRRGENEEDGEQRFMGIMHKSDRRAQCVRLPTSQPCFHKYASWGAATTSCFKRDWFEREMLNGRYC